MKLINYCLENAIYFGDTTNVLVVQNPTTFCKLLQQLYLQCNGLLGEWGLYQDKELPLSKHAVLLVDYFSVEVDDKKTLSKVVDRLKTIAMQAEYYQETCALLSAVNKYLQSVATEVDLPLSVEEMDVSQLLKSVSISLCKEKTSLLDKLVDFVSVLSALTTTKLLVCVNLKSYLTATQLSSFYLHCQHNSIYLLLIENAIYDKIEGETVLVCDEDMCEYYL